MGIDRWWYRCRGGWRDARLLGDLLQLRELREALLSTIIFLPLAFDLALLDAGCPVLL